MRKSYKLRCMCGIDNLWYAILSSGRLSCSKNLHDVLPPYGRVRSNQYLDSQKIPSLGQSVGCTGMILKA